LAPRNLICGSGSICLKGAGRDKIVGATNNAGLVADKKLLDEKSGLPLLGRLPYFREKSLHLGTIILNIRTKDNLA